MPSLAQLCLNLISKEYERFHFAFTVSNDNNLKLSFQFLKRRYSSKLCSQLFERRNLKDEYLESLLNEHLKFLDEQWLMNSYYQNSLKDILYRLPNLSEISCFLRNDEILENLAKFCPKIFKISSKTAEIDPESVFFKGHGVAYLSEKENECLDLKKISIDGVTISGVKHLIQNLKFLETFYHKNVPLALYSLHKENLPKLENVYNYNLVEMKLIDMVGLLPYYSDVLKICLNVCPKLKSLWCNISDSEQLDFFSNTRLENLRLSYPNGEVDQKINIDNVLKNCGCNLFLLVVHHFIISVSQLAVSCPKLEHLFFDNIDLTIDNGDSKADFPHDSKVFFPHLTNCAFCRVENNRLSDKALSLLLLSSPNIKYLTFSFCDLSLYMKACILKCVEICPLRIISFSYTTIELSYAKKILSSCPSLKVLNLENCELQEKNELLQFAETLSNKPRVCFQFL